MLKKLYYWLHRKLSKPEEKGEYSSGIWQDAVRRMTLNLCGDFKGRLLEVGCGEGLFLAELAKSNKKVQIFAVDNWKDILEKGKLRIEKMELKNIKLVLSDATSLPFKDSEFDIAVCINVIFNMESKQIVKKTVDAVSRICIKGAKIILDFRNSKDPLLYLKYKLAPYYDKTVKDLPLKTYRIEEMLPLLDGLGLKIIQKINLGFPLGALAPIIILELKKL